MNLIRFSLVLSAVVFCGSVRATAGLQLIKAGDRALFTSDGYSVIVAEVRAVIKLPDVRHGTHLATLQPLATLAGTHDPTADAALHIRFYADTWATSIKAAPTVGSTVLVVIRKEGDFTFAVSDLCEFMPNWSAMVAVDGLGDKQVAETIDKIRTGRAHARANAETNPSESNPAATAPSTQPSAGPLR